MPYPRGHVPVDGSNIIAVLILSNLIEFHPASFENRMVFSGQRFVDQPVGCYLNSTDLPDNLAGQHLAPACRDV